MKSLKYSFILFHILCLLLTGCQSNDGREERGSAQPMDGRALYQRNCAVCHGVVGQRQIGRTTLRDSRVSESEAWQIINRGQMPMPGFEDKLTEEERQKIVEFIFTLRE